MSLLYKILFAHACRSTHHKFALQALLHLRGESVEGWRDLFLHHYGHYLQGAKAPDDEFKDFRNHVLHVRDGNWGGAIASARRWYADALEALQDEDWADAAYSAGVLSHYFTDPLQPFHTGSSDAESAVHRAAEWTICNTYDQLIAIVEEQGGYPKIELGAGEDWLGELMLAGAREANRRYEKSIETYDLAKGSDDPLTGYDEAGQETIAPLVGRAVIGWSRVLERLFQESGATPIAAPTSLTTVVAALKIPKLWLDRRAVDAREREAIAEIYEELEKTGKVEKHLPEESRVVREQLARSKAPMVKPQSVSPVAAPKVETQKLATSAMLKAAPTEQPTATGNGASIRLKFYLEPSSMIEDAPSIGPKTGQRLRLVGVSTVAALLENDAADLASKLSAGAQRVSSRVSVQTVRDWQDQTRLVCRVPSLRGHDAQILVACGFRQPEKIAAGGVDAVWTQVMPFTKTSECQRIVRDGQPPDRQEVADWVSHAKLARAA
jgi:hypothetical protein